MPLWEVQPCTILAGERRAKTAMGMSALVKPFRNYYRIHQFDRQLFQQYNDGDTWTDLFCWLPELAVWLLCASSHLSRQVNRVFYATNHFPFQLPSVKKFNPQVTLRWNHLCEPINTMDVTERVCKSMKGYLTYVVLEDESEIIGFARIFAEREHFAIKSAQKILNSWKESINSKEQKREPSSDLTDIGHIIGRYYAQSLDGLVRKSLSKKDLATLRHLLTIPATLTSTGHTMIFFRDFETETLKFITSHSNVTSEVLHHVMVDMKRDRHMFNLIAVAGNPVCIPRFPDDLEESPFGLYRNWEPDELFRKLQKTLSDVPTYMGLPIRVDDNVIGVCALLGCFYDRDKELPVAFSFLRSLFSEFGRTIEKIRTTKASESLVQRIGLPVPLSEHDFMSGFVYDLYQPVLSLLWPNDCFHISFISRNTPQSAIVEFSRKVNLDIQEIKSHLRQSTVSEDLPLIALRNNPTDKAILVIPLCSSESDHTSDVGCLLIYGSLTTLSSRSLINICKNLRSAMEGALSSSIARYIGLDRLHQYNAVEQAYHHAWTALHDLKNQLQGFFLSQSRLKLLARNPNLGEQDLRVEIIKEMDAMFSSLQFIFDKAKEATDRNRLGHTERFEVAELLHKCHQEAFAYIPLPCNLRISGNTVLTSFIMDFKRVFVELLLNALKALARGTPNSPTISIRIEQMASRYVSISISDNSNLGGKVQRIKDALNDDNSTLFSIVVTTVKRYLQGSITVDGDDSACTIHVQLKDLSGHSDD